MAVKFGSDGTLYCNTVKYNYKQCRNIIADGSYGNISKAWAMSNVFAMSSPAGYKSYRCFLFRPRTTQSMLIQLMPTPIVNHKYYGGLMWKTDTSTFTANDNRFEWYNSDSANGTMVFANKNVATNGNWVKLSSIQTLSSVATGSWILRNFLVNSSSEGYCCKMMIIDLTDTFGAGNEPTKEWCDNNIREWETITNYGCVSNNVNIDNLSSRYYGSNLDKSDYNYTQLDSNWEPREYMYYLKGSSGSQEGYLYSKSAFSLKNTYKYYAYWDEHLEQVETQQSCDFYFPIAEPRIGSVVLVDELQFNGGGGMRDWKRASAFDTRTKFTNGSYNLRYDFNNGFKPKTTTGYTNVLRVTGVNLINAQSPLTQYNKYNNTEISINEINQEWCDRWIDGRSSPIIHIKDPANTSIKFNTNYDIICNDIEIRPEINKIIMDNTGTIKCRRLERVQNY